MLNRRLLVSLVSLAVLAAPAMAQEMAPHRAVYEVGAIENGKPTGDALGTYAYELKQTCDGYVIYQRLRLEATGQRSTLVSEQQTQMTESRDGRKLTFEHRSLTKGKQTGLIKGEAIMSDDGPGQARFTDPENQTVNLPKGTLFPVAIARATIRAAKAGENGLDALFFFGDKVKPPQWVNAVIGKVPRRLKDVKIPEGAEELVDGRTRIYYRAGFFDGGAKGQGEPAFEMSSVTLDNGVELYGTHEQGDGGIEYRITRLEPIPKPECK